MPELGLPFHMGSSLVATTGGYPSLQCTDYRLASLVAEHGLEGAQSTGSAVAVQRLSCSAACWIFPYQGSNPCLLHWQVYYSPLSHKGSLAAGFSIVSLVTIKPGKQWKQYLLCAERKSS